MFATATRHIDPAISPWSHLDIPQRMARVIERRRHFLDGTVTERDFHDEPETATLSLGELRAHLGAANILVHTEAPEPTYDRAARIAQGAAALLEVLPGRSAVIEQLVGHGFPRDEAGRLATEIAFVASRHWRRSCARQPDLPLPQLAREMLERNAE